LKINQPFNSRNIGSRPAPEGAPRAASANPAVAANAAPSQAQATDAASADFDAARVEQIRQDIKDGRYQMNAGRIADGLLASVRDMLGK
jgi:negative regulator of flagellin synthesis FlgM